MKVGYRRLCYRPSDYPAFIWNSDVTTPLNSFRKLTGRSPSGHGVPIQCYLVGEMRMMFELYLGFCSFNIIEARTRKLHFAWEVLKKSFVIDLENFLVRI